MAEITFVRHAETEANAAGVWIGQTDGPLSQRGVETLEALGHRLEDHQFDVVVSSPLSRAMDTAASFADNVEIDDQFIEINLGRWEGWNRQQVIDEDGELLDRAVHDRNVPMGATGETLNQAGARVLAAVDTLAERIGESGKAAVVTHGGLLQAVLHRHLAGGSQRVHAFTENTGIHRISWEWGGPRLAMFNDVSHLGSVSQPVREALDSGTPVLALVRHGRTQANVEQRWQGRGNWGLDELGHRQAEALSIWYGQKNLVYSSPLDRASETAGYVASSEVITVEDLAEISMGEWENLTTEEIVERWGPLMESIFRDGLDLKRGVTGESFGELRARITNAIDALEMGSGDTTVVVSHGGAIRSYISGMTQTTDSQGESLLTPRNTSVTHVALTDRGPEVLDYGVAPHLDRLT